MSTDSPNYSGVDPSQLSIGVVCASFNPILCEALLSRVLSCLEENGKLQNLIIERVPGSNEIPSGIDLILNNNSLDCIIGLGVVIKGSTSHHHLVAESSGHAMQNLALQYHTPVINGIVVTDDLRSAEERITGQLDRGLEFARAALEMAVLRKKWTKT
jgi:6,7-dimethyl-8-ribityllumazine synthase